MPLSEPVTRDPIHVRSVTCRGYRRADGLWDVEGHLVDTKAYAFDSTSRGTLEPGEPVHEMWLRLTVDDDLVVRGVEAATDAAPFPVCPSIAPRFTQLVGLAIAPGWNAKVKQMLGGVQGCTHLVELLGPIATTAFQTIFPLRERERRQKGDRAPVPLEKTPVGTCHALRADGPVVKEIWPEHYTGGGG
ncbi:MAG: DUF2889 domain-containing protein [Alphaproteobacteria bacterium]